jgi:hypothetical protein
MFKPLWYLLFLLATGGFLYTFFQQRNPIFFDLGVATSQIAAIPLHRSSWLVMRMIPLVLLVLSIAIVLYPELSTLMLWR